MKDIISHELPGIMNCVLEGRERLRMNEKFTDSPVMNKTLEEYKKMGQKKTGKIQLWLPFNSK